MKLLVYGEAKIDLLIKNFYVFPLSISQEGSVSLLVNAVPECLEIIAGLYRNQDPFTMIDGLIVDWKPDQLNSRYYLARALQNNVVTLLISSKNNNERIDLSTLKDGQEAIFSPRYFNQSFLSCLSDFFLAIQHKKMKMFFQSI